MATIQELISQLRNFRTRSSAKDALFAKGEEATEPLISAIRDANVGVRWAVVSILGELAAKRAVPDLVEALKDPDVRSAAADALRRITGKDHGQDYQAWKQAVAADGSAPGTDEGAPGGATDADLVRQAVYGTDISAEDKGAAFTLCVPIVDRHQDVTLNFRAKDADGVHLVVVYTRCGPADQKYYEWALRQNVKMSAGAIAVADIEDKPNFIVVDVLVRTETTPSLLLESVRRVARKGDQLESALTKADEY